MNNTTPLPSYSIKRIIKVFFFIISVMLFIFSALYTVIFFLDFQVEKATNDLSVFSLIFGGLGLNISLFLLSFILMLWPTQKTPRYLFYPGLVLLVFLLGSVVFSYFVHQ